MKNLESMALVLMSCLPISAQWLHFFQAPQFLISEHFIHNGLENSSQCVPTKWSRVLMNNVIGHFDFAPDIAKALTQTQLEQCNLPSDSSTLIDQFPK